MRQFVNDSIGGAHARVVGGEAGINHRIQALSGDAKSVAAQLHV
jgi:hypothetical protein